MFANIIPFHAHLQQMMPAFTVPLMVDGDPNATLAYNPSQLRNEPEPLPLVVMALQPNDPWSMALCTTEASIDAFLTGTS